ncbi:hypothetical protein CPSG_08096 [Coccidioides posadasii str. Silveira]|uniref:Uncharacterized protein n=1 Tax=Coccidioides posadasii (strain RMSCC 757 / Silveira) TaxID=443226 RepID=E9DDD4_COCPS|nr:hypothetical protein CPSG_08096 [Coccidioides posadasii str. Silveira]
MCRTHPAQTYAALGISRVILGVHWHHPMLVAFHFQYGVLRTLPSSTKHLVTDVDPFPAGEKGGASHFQQHFLFHCVGADVPMVVDNVWPIYYPKH